MIRCPSLFGCPFLALGKVFIWNCKSKSADPACEHKGVCRVLHRASALALHRALALAVLRGAPGWLCRGGDLGLTYA